MTPQEDMSRSSALKFWQRAKIASGALVIFAVIATTVSGIAALIDERDTSGAMKLPAALAFFSIVAFVYTQRKILPTRPPNQSPEPTR